MNPQNLLRSLALAGVAGITATTIGTAPAQAMLIAALEWDDGTSNFYDDIVVDGGLDTDDTLAFTVTFSPDLVAASFNSEGLLNDYFDTPPGELFDLNPPAPVSGFRWFDDGPLPNSELYKNNDELVWDFDTGPVIAGTSVEVTLPADSEFACILEVDDAVSCNLLIGEFEYATTGGPSAGFTGTATSSEFDFGQVPGTQAGGYEAEFVEGRGVPEPASMLGILAVGALGFVTKRKQEQK